MHKVEANQRFLPDDSRIILHFDEGLRYHDTGGGYRITRGEICIDASLSQRMKRKIALYESLGSLLEFCLSHEQLEEVSDILVDVLDQLEPCLPPETEEITNKAVVLRNAESVL